VAGRLPGRIWQGGDPPITKAFAPGAAERA